MHKKILGTVSFLRSCTLVLQMLAFLGVSQVGVAQTPVRDLYTNFVGDWVGYDDTTLHGVPAHVRVEILITEQKNRKSILMAYTYGLPGQQDYSRISKIMELDPVTSEMKLRWKGLFENPSKYKVDGLGEFAKSGLGSFTAEGAAPGSVPGVGRFTLNLGTDTFSYKWEADTGSGFITVSTFLLHRQKVKV